ncbi:MAG: sigma-70 family RNA polymerase sigma factor [Gammaproteobacteria bacterium]|nr:sigma-70 family RNA polymerase sigma factor [Gammaproteobacteria bacterium]MDP2348508.1 sigma-70 family RNA polymerase sigma factor [Gammaproteobacteria bacterium]
MTGSDDINSRKAASGWGTQTVPDPWEAGLRKVAQGGDRAEFRKIFDHFAPLIKAFLMKGMSAYADRSMAEEMTQEVMLKVWNKAASFNSGKASVNTWIFTIARNTRIDFIRRNERADRNIDIEDIWHEADSPEPLVDLQQRRVEAVIRNALSTLPEEQALVLEKAFIDSKSHNEIAEELDLPLGTVKSRIRLALNKLQILIDR